VSPRGQPWNVACHQVAVVWNGKKVNEPGDSQVLETSPNRRGKREARSPMFMEPGVNVMPGLRFEGETDIEKQESTTRTGFAMNKQNGGRKECGGG